MRDNSVSRCLGVIFGDLKADYVHSVGAGWVELEVACAHLSAISRDASKLRDDTRLRFYTYYRLKFDNRVI